MEMKLAKISDSNRKVVVDMKRKRDASTETQLAGTTRLVLPLQCTTVNNNYSLHKQPSSKQRKLNESQITKCGPHSQMPLLMYYSNFKRSGLPQRLMCYNNNNGEWTDFPQNFLALVRENLKVKKSATEVEFDGRVILLDFLHMVKVDLENGQQQSIGWIDEAGNCFFPEIFSDDEERHNCCHHRIEKEGLNDINLQLEIEIKMSDFPSNLKESMGESNDVTCQKPMGINLIAEAGDKEEEFGGNQHIEENNHMHHGNLNSERIMEMLSMGLTSFAEVVDICARSGDSVEARLELFEKQIEITRRYRGDANVQYAWLPSSKEAVSGIMMYGLGPNQVAGVKSFYGIGVHLMPANCAQSSARYCDIDENGVRHMVLCRVIMGKMELVNRGSKQSHPISEDFDSGVDDLQHPSIYIVWNMNMNTHIYPEYAVSFKAYSNDKGFQDGNESMVNAHRVTTAGKGAQVELKLDAARASMEFSSNQAQLPISHEGAANNNVGSCSSTRMPKTPWMPFPLLFEAISDKISSKDMDSVLSNYKLMRSEAITRDIFVKRLRLIVGDQLLRAAIISLRPQVLSKEAVTPKPK